MATYTPNKGYPQPQVGDDDNQWGSLQNSAFAIMDLNLGGVVGTVLPAGGGNVTIGAVAARNLIQQLSGSPTAAATVLLPPVGGLYAIQNSASGSPVSVGVGVTAAAGGTVTVPNGTTMLVTSDGTNAESATSAYIENGQNPTFQNVVANSVTADAMTVTNSVNAGLILNNTAAGGHEWEFVAGSDGAVRIVDETAAAATRFSIDVNGTVAIGALVASSVSGSGAATFGGSGTFGGAVIAQSSTGNTALTANNTGPGGHNWSMLSTNNGSCAFFDATSGASRMSIDSYGIVHILYGNAQSFSNAGLLTTAGASTGYSGSTGIGALVTNNVAASGFIATSDAEVKSDLRPMRPADGVAFVDAIAPFTFIKHAASDKSDAGQRESGFIAQDLLGAGYDHMVGAVPDDGLAKGFRLVANYDQTLAYHQAALRWAIEEIKALKGAAREPANDV